MVRFCYNCATFALLVIALLYLERPVAGRNFEEVLVMQVHLVNPNELSFGVGVITPRWLYVLAGATPQQYGDPLITDETLEQFDPTRIQAGDVVGIGIHTANACRGY